MEALNPQFVGAPRPAAIQNGGALELSQVPLVGPDYFHDMCVAECRAGGRLAALLALPGDAELLAVLARDRDNELLLLRGRVEARSFQSLTARLPQAQAFEREIFEVRGIEPIGHPWLKPLRRHDDLEKGEPLPPHPFFRVEGPGIHEVAVGPVHAGVIEPGHFRFQCQGETVHSLEIQLGYQQRGVEELILASAPGRRLAVAETIAGDTTVGHALAHVGALEGLAGSEAPLRGQALRAIGLELERLANHAGDLGALCNDVGYLPGASYFGRLRGEFLNLSLELCGSRFGRGLVVAGGTRFDLTDAQRKDFLGRLKLAWRDLESTAQMTFDTPSVLSRFEGTGALTGAQAEDLGLVGPAGRACGLDRDVRQDHPFAIYRFAHIPVARAESGDVMARAQVRWLEVERSVTFLQEQIAELAAGPTCEPVGPLKPGAVAASLVEGWRGEVVHVALTGPKGELSGYKVFDPSLHNWFGLAMALRGNGISDFPLCNKSFNLSYAGYDL